MNREYIWLDGRPLAVVEGGQVYQFLWDHIMRPVMATGATGAVVWAASYLPFGGIDQVYVDTGALTQNLRFPGQWFQAETGLHQNWHRDYDPTTGRYLQADPLGLVDGPSVYGYVRQSPMRYVDPLGYYTFRDAHRNLRVRGVEPQGKLGEYTEDQIYDEWLDLERKNTDWLKELPRCPRTLDECRGEEWEDVGPANLFHRPGVFELRSKPTPGGHATQCVYDAAGNLMLDIPAAGSADYKANRNTGIDHFDHDVMPWVRAESLDRRAGNRKRREEYYEVRPRQ